MPSHKTAMRAAIIALMLMFGSPAGAGCGDLCEEGWWKTVHDAELQALLAAGADGMPPFGGP